MNDIDKLIYNTRDADGNDIIKTVVPKAHKEISVDYLCMCGQQHSKGIPIKSIVSSNFTDWGYVSDHVCRDCAFKFQLFPYSYIINSTGIRLLNVREMAEEILKPQKGPFKIVVSASQKKHLFYKAVVNYDPENFIVNLEDERISVNLAKLRQQFVFISNLQALGESKKRLKDGEIRYDILQKVGTDTLKYLKSSLKQRDIQIPLFLSQEADVEESQAIKNVQGVIL